MEVEPSAEATAETAVAAVAAVAAGEAASPLALSLSPPPPLPHKQQPPPASASGEENPACKRGTWYGARVVDYNARTGRHKLEYKRTSGGDDDELQARFETLDDPRPPPRANRHLSCELYLLHGR